MSLNYNANLTPSLNINNFVKCELRDIYSKLNDLQSQNMCIIDFVHLKLEQLISLVSTIPMETTEGCLPTLMDAYALIEKYLFEQDVEESPILMKTGLPGRPSLVIPEKCIFFNVDSLKLIFQIC